MPTVSGHMRKKANKTKTMRLPKVVILGISGFSMFFPSLIKRRCRTQIHSEIFGFTVLIFWKSKLSNRLCQYFRESGKTFWRLCSGSFIFLCQPCYCRFRSETGFLLGEENPNLCPSTNEEVLSSSRRVKILTTGIHWVFRGLKFEPNTEIGKNGHSWMGTSYASPPFAWRSSLPILWKPLGHSQALISARPGGHESQFSEIIEPYLVIPLSDRLRIRLAGVAECFLSRLLMLMIKKMPIVKQIKYKIYYVKR